MPYLQFVHPAANQVISLNLQLVLGIFHDMYMYAAAVHTRSFRCGEVMVYGAMIYSDHNIICIRRLKGGDREGLPLSSLPDHSVQMVLSPAGLPGQCLPLNGSSGHVDIRLRTRTYVDAVTLEHVPR